MKKLKIILQSNYLYVFLSIFLSIYIIIFTVLIKYESKINSNTLEGIITSISISKDKVSFILNEKEKIKCTYYISKDDNTNYYDYLGRYVKVLGNKKELNNNTIPNTFNYRKYLYNNRIYSNYVIDKIEIIKKPNIFYKIKGSIYNKNNNYDDKTNSYLNLFILGDKSLLDNDTYSIYQNNGIWHLFAISGMHISLIILVLSKLFNKLKYKVIIISLFLLYFMFLTNYSASVERVCIFYYLKNILEYKDIKLNNIKILLLTAFICILINPFIIYNNGFIYSFSITLGIILNSNKLHGSYLNKIFNISLLAFIVCLPISINNNYEINLLSIILNIFYVPFISLIFFPCVIMTFIIPYISIILNVLIDILETTNVLFNSIKLSLIIPKMSIYLILLYYLFLYLAYKKINKKYVILSVFVLIINILIPKLDNSYYSYFLDVGQGDSSLIITPYKKEVIMIDTGGIVNSDYHVTNNIIVFLKSMGINKINSLILSHGDYDHLGDAINLVNNFKVEKVIFNCGSFNKLENELMNALNSKKIEYLSCINELDIKNNKLYFLNTKDYNN